MVVYDKDFWEQKGVRLNEGDFNNYQYQSR